MPCLRRRSRKQFRRDTHSYAPNTDTAGKEISSLRRPRFVPQQLPPPRILDGRIRRSPAQYDVTDYYQPPGMLTRRLWQKRPRPDAFNGRILRSLAKPPPWLEYETTFTDRYRVEDTTQNLYELYVGEDGSDPDFTAAPDATNATLPFNFALTPPLAGTKEYRLAVRYRDEYGVISLNQYTRSFTIDDGGALVTPDPSSPQDSALMDGNGYRVIVSAIYYPDEDGEDNRADTWDIYYTDDGTDPDPALDTPVEVTMGTIATEERIVYSLGPFSAEDDVRVIVRARRSSDDADDGNVTVLQHDVLAQPDAPTDGLSFGGETHEYLL